MSYAKVIRVGGLRLAAALCVSASLVAFEGAWTAANAEDAAPAADAAAAPAKAPRTWVKICGKVQFADTKAKDPKTAPPVEKQVCATQHEKFDPGSGGLLLSIAVREMEGNDKKILSIATPLGVLLPPGIAMQFDDEKDEKKFDRVRFDFCAPAGCSSESELTPELLDKMSKAKSMHIYAITLQGAPLGFKISMEDLATTMAGAPVDSAKYFDARKNLVMGLREKMIAKQKATQAAAAEAVKGIQEDQAAAAGGAAPAEPPKQ